MLKKKYLNTEKRGGKRKGSGRKKKEPTVTKRLPLSILPEVQQLIDRTKTKDK